MKKKYKIFYIVLVLYNILYYLCFNGEGNTARTTNPEKMKTVTIKCPITDEETVYDIVKDNLVALKEDLSAGKMVSFYFIENGDTTDTGLGININKPESIESALENLDFYGLGFAAAEITEYLKG